MNRNNSKKIISNYNLRLDLSLLDSGLSRNVLKRMIKDGLVKVNGNIVRKPKFKVSKGDSIEYIEFDYSNNDLEISPQKMKLNIIYEDNNVIVINKPEGLVVHPGAGNPKNTLLNGIIFKLKFDSNLKERPGVVHRLDKNTSGVIIFAKNPATLDFLVDQFKSRKVEKRYIALVKGIVNPRDKKINFKDKKNFFVKGNISRSKTNRKNFVFSENGKESITYFKIVKYINDEFTLLEAYPKTGRTHQIRVSLASINHPVIGDKVYSRRYSISSYPHMFLHAYSLKLEIPDIGIKEFSASLPNFWNNIPGVMSIYKL